MKSLMKNRVLMLVGAVLLPTLAMPAHAAKYWDPGEAIQLEIDGTDDAIAPTNVGANGIVRRPFSITKFRDKDHWIDTNESEPTYEDWPEEDLYYEQDIELYFNAPAPGSLVFDDQVILMTAPTQGGLYDLRITGTDASQTIDSNDDGNRHDLNNEDYWWTEVDPEAV
jgi:hypothetical protein